MKSSRARLIRILYGCREFCWLYALANLVVQPLLPARLPIIGMLAIYGVAAGLSGAHTSILRPNTAHRLLFVGGAAVAATVMMLLMTVDIGLLSERDGGAWGAWNQPEPFHTMVAGAAVALWTWALIWAGTRLKRLPLTHRSAVDQFDKGLGLLAALLFLKLLLVTQCGAQLPELPGPPIGLYLLSSLLAILICQVDATRLPQAWRRHLRLGIVAAVVGGTLTLMMGLSSISQPALRSAALSVQGLVAQTLDPVGPLATRAVKAMAAPVARRLDQSVNDYRPQSQTSAHQTSPWVIKMMRYGGMLLSAMLIAGSIYGLQGGSRRMNSIRDLLSAAAD